MKQKILVITGPTAAGKTGLSLKLAKKFNCEIISADSRQVYRGLDIGSAKVKLQNGKAGGIKHYLIDVASPRVNYTAARFKRDSERAIKKIIAKSKTPMIVGGTVFYIQALTQNLAIPEVKPNLALRKKLEKQTANQLFKKLKKLDARRAKTIDANNKRRLIRAIEIATKLGKVPKQKTRNKYDVLVLGLKQNDKKLKNLINKRVDARVAGIIKEIKSLRKQNLSFQRLVNFGLEYKYFSLYLMGKLSKTETIEQLKTATWQFAKRQYTFLKKLPVVWIKNQQQAESKIKVFFKK